MPLSLHELRLQHNGCNAVIPRKLRQRQGAGLHYAPMSGARFANSTQLNGGNAHIKVAKTPP